MNTAECRVTAERDQFSSELQWSRRVNTAEWRAQGRTWATVVPLQWSRRVNTAECQELDSHE